MSVISFVAESRISLRPLVLLICFGWGVTLGFCLMTFSEPTGNDAPEDEEIAVTPPPQKIPKTKNSDLVQINIPEPIRPPSPAGSFVPGRSTIKPEAGGTNPAAEPEALQDPPGIASFELDARWGLTGRTTPPPKVRKVAKPVTNSIVPRKLSPPQLPLPEPELNM